MHAKVAATKCNFQEHLDVALRDRLVAGINKTELHRNLFFGKDTSFHHLRVVCETTEDLNNPGTSSPVTQIMCQTPPIPEQAACFKKEAKSQDVQLVWKSASPSGMQVLISLPTTLLLDGINKYSCSIQQPTRVFLNSFVRYVPRLILHQ